MEFWWKFHFCVVGCRRDLVLDAILFHKYAFWLSEKSGVDANVCDGDPRGPRAADLGFPFRMLLALGEAPVQNCSNRSFDLHFHEKHSEGGRTIVVLPSKYFLTIFPTDLP